MVRAKFRVRSIERTMGAVPKFDAAKKVEYQRGELWSIRLYPVGGGGDPEHENTKFWMASPGGEIRLDTVNAAAVQQFELEREFYVDFTPAE